MISRSPVQENLVRYAERHRPTWPEHYFKHWLGELIRERLAVRQLRWERMGLCTPQTVQVVKRNTEALQRLHRVLVLKYRPDAR